MKSLNLKNMLNNKNWSPLMVIAFVAFSFAACERDDTTLNEETVQTLETSSEDLASMDDLMVDLDNEIDYQLEFRGGDPQSDCPTVTVTPDNETFPRTYTIDYGTDGCTDRFGRLRKGIIYVEINTNWWDVNYVRTTTFENFSIDEVQVEGTRINRRLSNQPFSFTREVINGKLTFVDDSVAEWNATHTITQTAGQDTPYNRFDNVFTINGSSQGINRRGTSFSATILDPLVRTADCLFLTQGLVELRANNATHTLNYGDGTCDRFGELTLSDGTVRTVRLFRWWRP